MMQALRQLGGGVIIAIISVILVLGGISLAIAETLPSQAVSTQAPPTLPQSIPSPTATIGLLPPTLTSDTPTTSYTETSIASNTVTATLALPPTVCAPPGGWIAIMVTTNDTIYSLSQRYNTSPENLSAKNCLTSLNLVAGTLIYVPPVPATAKVIPCSPPAGWVKTHTVQAGDNLYRIALSYGLTYQKLQAGNCMGSSVLIYAGQKLWVPNVPTLTPVPGVTIIPTFPTQTMPVTPSFTTVPATEVPATATSTFIVTATFPVTATPSLTPFPSKAP